MTGPRVFTPAELAWAMRLKKQGQPWALINRSLGCRGGEARQAIDPELQPRRGDANPPRGFTAKQIALAKRLRAKGRSWPDVACALGKANADGIRRQIDPDWRAYRNSYHVKYRRARRASEEQQS